MKNLRKNTRQEALGSTKKVWGMLFLTGIIALFLIGIVSAWEFDNKKSYDETEQKITINLHTLITYFILSRMISC